MSGFLGWEVIFRVTFVLEVEGESRGGEGGGEARDARGRRERVLRG